MYTGGGDIAYADESTSYFKSSSLTLGGQIGVNFYVSKDENLAGISFDVAARNTQKVTYSSAVESGDKLKKFTCYVSAIEMSNDITAKLYSKDGTVVESYDYSVQKYISSYMKNHSSDNSAATNLVKAIKDYGFYTQKFLAEAHGWTLNDKKYSNTFVSMDISYVTLSIDDKSKDAFALVSTLTLTKTKNSGDVSLDLALNLDYETSAYVYITAPNGKTLKSSDVSMTQKNATLSCDLVKSGDKTYIVKSHGISAHKLSDDITLKAKFEGSTSDDIVISFAPLYYAKVVLSADITSTSPYTQKGKDAMTSLIGYCDYTKAIQESQRYVRLAKKIKHMKTKEAQKAEYIAAELEIIRFEDADIITASGDTAGHSYTTPKITL